MKKCFLEKWQLIFFCITIVIGSLGAIKGYGALEQRVINVQNQQLTEYNQLRSDILVLRQDIKALASIIYEMRGKLDNKNLHNK